MGVKITELLAIDQEGVTDLDVLPLVDLESNSTKKITIKKLREGVLNIDNGDAEEGSIGNGVLLSVSEAGGLSANFNLPVLREQFRATGNIAYDPFTGSFNYSTPTSDGIVEGTINKYYTDARSRSAISVSGVGLAYNPSTGVITFNQGDTGAVTHVGGFVFDGFTIATEPAIITGYIAANKLHIVTLTSGTPAPGMNITGGGTATGTSLVDIFDSGGTSGGAGSTWNIDGPVQNIGSALSPISLTLGQGDFVLDPSGSSVQIAGNLKIAGNLTFPDTTVQTTAFPGYNGWTNPTDTVAFTSSGIGKKVSLNYGSNSVFVDTTGVTLRGGASSIRVNTSGQLVFPDNSVQTTAFGMDSMPNGAVLFKNNNQLSSSTSFIYSNNILTVDTINVKDVNFVGSGTVDISSNSNLQIGAVGTISINGAYTIPTTSGAAGKVLTSAGSSSSWQYVGADHDYTAPNSSIFQSRQYNGGTVVSFTPSTTDFVEVTNAVNQTSSGSTIYVNMSATPHVNAVPVGAIVNGPGITDASVVSSAQDTLDPTLWKIVIDQYGTFSNTDVFQITWGSAGTGPVTWWDAANSPLGATNFRGAIVDYHAFCTGSGMIVGTITISNYGNDNVVVHHESTSGSGQLGSFSLWNVDGETKLRFSAGTYTQTAVIHFTSKVFYGPLTYSI